MPNRFFKLVASIAQYYFVYAKKELFAWHQFLN